MTPRAQVFRAWFAVTPGAARLADALYGAEGQTVSHADLMTAAGLTQHGLYGAAQQLRLAMDPLSLLSVQAVGYRLSEVGLADCDRALIDAVARERAA